MGNTKVEREQDTFFDKLCGLMTVDSDIENIVSIFHILKEEMGKAK